MRRDRFTTALERLDACRDTALKNPVIDDYGRLDRDLYLVSRVATERITQELTELGGRLRRFDQEITNPVEERLRAAAVRERAVKTLVEQRRASMQKAFERRERLDLDELAQRRWQGRRPPRAQGGPR